MMCLAHRNEQAKLLMTLPGVAHGVALSLIAALGDLSRFTDGDHAASYLGLVPLEDSSGNRRRLGHITKQGNSMMRFLLVEAAQVTVRSLPEWRSKYFHLAMGRGQKIAKVALARRLAVQTVLDDAQGMGLRAVEKVRFARGTTR